MRRVNQWGHPTYSTNLPQRSHTMTHQTTSAVAQSDRLKTLSPRVGASNAPAMNEELLPFTVRLVRNEDDLSKAVQIRHSAYARHLPDFAETLRSAETADTENG